MYCNKVEFAHAPYRQTRSGSSQSVCVSVVEMSSEGSDRQQCPLRPSTLLELAPVVASKMQFQREMVSNSVVVQDVQAHIPYYNLSISEIRIFHTSVEERRQISCGHSTTK